jgi:hypothetical protein
VSLQLASRGRAEAVVALAPAGGWARGDESYRDTLAHFATMQELLEAAARTPAKTPDFLSLAGSVPVPAGKRGTAWDDVLRQTRRARAERRR